MKMLRKAGVGICWVVLAAWPTLPEPVKARIAGMVEAVRLNRP